MTLDPEHEDALESLATWAAENLGSSFGGYFVDADDRPIWLWVRPPSEEFIAMGRTLAVDVSKTAEVRVPLRELRHAQSRISRHREFWSPDGLVRALWVSHLENSVVVTVERRAERFEQSIRVLVGDVPLIFREGKFLAC